ncbi:hypothetical protein DPMN_132508 [Dreissena polymorpha]|uniref:Glycosyl hydrolase family 38 C-terminal domain-containing protein n=1 Tax=Dreissena polymorpha TaxID=45954 RepID=A0A9D4FU02_DREPO|nr:hypothetical protein DPMN_132508 [Dreissena polymorpha]
MKTILMSLLSRGKEHDSKLLLEDQIKPGKRSIMQKRIIESTQEIKIVFANTISKRRYEIVNIIVTSANCAVFSARNAVVSSQITRIASPEKQELFSVSFAVDIPAFGIEVYTLKPTQQENNIMSYLPVTSEEHPLKISNDHIACVFNASTGMLQSVTVNNVETKMEAQFMIYQSDHGGAYIFGPKGEANRFKTEKLEILRVHGNLWSEVIIRSNGFVERYRLFNIEGIQGLGVHISTEVDIAAVGANNVDVIYRFNTDVNNDINFYTDQNGYQLMGRKTNSSHRIESNYYPMVTMMVIEDSNTRLTLHSKQAHGVSSLTSGQFEVMLDRHTFRDDGRGLGQGVYDNVRVNSDFVLQLEHKKSKTQTQEERYAFSTKEAVLLNEFLQNTLQIYSLVDSRISLVNKIHPMKDSAFPCDTSIVGFRNIFNEDLQYKFTSLVLHRKSFQCGFQENEKFVLKMCKASKSSKLSIKSVFPKLKVKLYESSLSMLHDKGQLSAETDISPQKNELRSFKIVI